MTHETPPVVSYLPIVLHHCVTLCYLWRHRLCTDLCIHMYTIRVTAVASTASSSSTAVSSAPLAQSSAGDSQTTTYAYRCPREYVLTPIFQIILKSFNIITWDCLIVFPCMCRVFLLPNNTTTDHQYHHYHHHHHQQQQPLHHHHHHQVGHHNHTSAARVWTCTPALRVGPCLGHI